MAYRKTDFVLARIAARKAKMVKAAIKIIEKDGFYALTAAAVVKHSGTSMGSLFNIFPDMAELIAHTEATVMNLDREAMETQVADTEPGAAQVVDALGVIFDIFAGAGVSREMMAHSEAYRETITRTLAHIIGASDLCPREEARDCARVALGAIFGMSVASGSRAQRFSRATVFILRGMGVSERKAMELVS